jgi:small nuclear ribonucleoprotein D3
MSIGVPIKILHEAEGHVVTIESVTSEVYRGKLVEAEDNMNCQLSNVTVTYRDGRQAQLEYIYVRGSKIRFMIFPDMLKVKTTRSVIFGFIRLNFLFLFKECTNV